MSSVPPSQLLDTITAAIAEWDGVSSVLYSENVSWIEQPRFQRKMTKLGLRYAMLHGRPYGVPSYSVPGNVPSFFQVGQNWGIRLLTFRDWAYVGAAPHGPISLNLDYRTLAGVQIDGANALSTYVFAPMDISKESVVVMIQPTPFEMDGYTTLSTPKPIEFQSSGTRWYYQRDEVAASRFSYTTRGISFTFTLASLRLQEVLEMLDFPVYGKGIKGGSRINMYAPDPEYMAAILEITQAIDPAVRSYSDIVGGGGSVTLGIPDADRTHFHNGRIIILNNPGEVDVAQWRVSHRECTFGTPAFNQSAETGLFSVTGEGWFWLPPYVLADDTIFFMCANHAGEDAGTGFGEEFVFQGPVGGQVRVLDFSPYTTPNLWRGIVDAYGEGKLDASQSYPQPTLADLELTGSEV